MEKFFKDAENIIFIIIESLILIPLIIIFINNINMDELINNAWFITIVGGFLVAGILGGINKYKKKKIIITEKQKSYLFNIYQEQIGTYSSEDYISVKENGSCIIKHTRLQYAKTNISLLIIEFYSDQPGYIKINNVFDNDLKIKLNFTTFAKTANTLTICIFFDPIKKAGTYFNLLIETHYENYFKNLIDKKYETIELLPLSNIRPTHIIEHYKFPNIPLFENVKYTFLKHFDSSKINSNIFSIKKEKYLELYIEYDTNNMTGEQIIGKISI